MVSVTVVVPTYDRAKMLRSALRTVQAQTLQDWECRVIDDGSTDETGRVLGEFAADARFKPLRNETNLGMNASRNRAIEAALGAWIAFLDSDDLWLPDKLEAFLREARAKPEAGFLFSNAYVHRYGRIVGTLFDRRRPLPEGRVPGHYAIGDARLPYVTTNVAIRAEAFKKWGLFRTDMRTLDTELFARFLREGLAVAALPEPLSVRRLHDEQLTGRYAENFAESMQALAASGAGEEEARRLRREVGAQVGGYLLKAGQGARARRFLEDALGGAARREPAYWLSFLPSPALAAARRARRLWLRARYHPLVAPGEYAEVLDWLAPYLREEA